MKFAIAAAVGLVCMMLGAAQARAGEISDDRFTVTFEEVDEKRIKHFLNEANDAFTALTGYLGIRYDRRIRIRVFKTREAPVANARDAVLTINANRFLDSVRGPRGTSGRVPGIVHDLTDIILPSRNPEWTDLLQYGFGVFVQERFGKGARAYPAMGAELYETTARLIVDYEGFIRIQDTGRLLARLPPGRAARLTMLHQGSFVKFLVENFGLGKYLRVHRGARFADVYGKDLCGLEVAWVAFMVERFPTTAEFAKNREPCTAF